MTRGVIIRVRGPPSVSMKASMTVCPSTTSCSGNQTPGPVVSSRQPAATPAASAGEPSRTVWTM